MRHHRISRKPRTGGDGSNESDPKLHQTNYTIRLWGSIVIVRLAGSRNGSPRATAYRVLIIFLETRMIGNRVFAMGECSEMGLMDENPQSADVPRPGEIGRASCRERV